MSEWIRVSDKKPYCSRDKDSLGKLCEAMDKADAYLEGKAQVKYGCHIDVPFGEAPYKSCVVATDRAADCGLARKFDSKEECSHWAPVTDK